MGFFSNLFKKGDEPTRQYSDAVLGTMQWCEDAESWLGEYRGTKFSLAYDGAVSPAGKLIAYAIDILADRQWLESSLANAKREARREYGDFYQSEIDSLAFGEIHFYLYKGNCRILGNLEGGKDDRLWRIEYGDRHCYGIGFDR